MKTIRKMKKLSINQETLRVLKDIELVRLVRAVGGGEVQGSLDCTITYPGCHE